MLGKIRIPLLSAYRPVLTDGRYSRLISASAVSFLGDGMALVGIPWLAIQLAQPDQGGVVTGLSLAAYTLPGALGALVLGRWFGGMSAQKLVGASTGLRTLGLATIVALAAADQLNAFSYIALLAVSSLFSAWRTRVCTLLSASFSPMVVNFPRMPYSAYPSRSASSSARQLLA